MNTVAIIAAAAEDNALGKDNDLLWHLPDDFKRFKSLTMGHSIIMGRKTYESFPKPLPKRKHIIITRNKDYTVPHDNCFVVQSLPQAMEMVANEKLSYIIGGGEIYKLAMQIANKIELTRVHGNFKDADTFFPEIDTSSWELATEQHHPKDEKHAYAFTYLTYLKI